MSFFNINTVLRRKAMLLLALVCLTVLAGCGGGGGGGGSTTQTSVTGTVLDVATDLPPTGATTIAIGGASATADATTGAFTVQNVNPSTTTATITSGGLTARTIALSLTANTKNDLGLVYLSASGYTATVTGRVVATVNGQTQPVGGAKVTIAGSQTITTTDGKFSVGNLPVGLGGTQTPVGTVTATGYSIRNIVLLTFALASGSQDIGDQPLGTPLSTTPPSTPYTVQVKLTSGGMPLTTGGSVSLFSGNTNLGTAVNDGAGNFYFWVVPGAYSAQANVNGSTKTSATITLTAPDVPVSTTIAF